MRSYGLKRARAGDFYSRSGPCTFLAWSVDSHSEIFVSICSDDFQDVTLTLGEAQTLLEMLWQRPVTARLVFLIAQRMEAGLSDDDIVEIEGCEPVGKAVAA